VDGVRLWNAPEKTFPGIMTSTKPNFPLVDQFLHKDSLDLQWYFHATFIEQTSRLICAGLDPEGELKPVSYASSHCWPTQAFYQCHYINVETGREGDNDIIIN